MRDNRSAPLTMWLRRGKVCVVEGFGIRICVDKQHLVVEDGLGRSRRTRRYSRATHGLSRLVVIGAEGYVTFGAIRWLTRLGIGYLHLDHDGSILASIDNGSADARLRRLQAHAATAPVGVEIARRVLGAKVDGQVRNLELTNSSGAREAIGYWQQQIGIAAGLDHLLEAEREAAAAYWGSWAGMRLRFAKRDLDWIPEHWSRVGTRHSPLSNGPRVAITPVNAILNYLYAILEAETRIACLTLGLDPGLGIWHADYRARDSFVLDLMEATRPDVDRLVLQLIATRAFTKNDFGETSRGVCRLLPSLAVELAQTAGQWRDLVAPHVEQVAQLLACEPGSRIDQLPTPLTRRKRMRGQDARRRPAPPRRELETPAAQCKRCRARVPHRDRVYCDACLALPQAERRQPLESVGPAAREQARTARLCKTCGEPVPHRKRVYCDDCFAKYEAELREMRRPCKRCAQPVPHRKRVFCDECIAAQRGELDPPLKMAQFSASD